MQKNFPLSPFSASLALALPMLAQAQTQTANERPLLPLPQSAVLTQPSLSSDSSEITFGAPQTKREPDQNQSNSQNQASDNAHDTNSDTALTQAIQQRDFKQLEKLLAQPADEAHNPLLRLDAQATLALSQAKYSQAIDYYQTLLKSSPDSHGVRMDLATSLFQDKRFREAEQEFKQIQKETDETSSWRQHADYYLKQIREAEKWQPEISANYVETDNVNHATKQNEFIINGMKFQRRDEDKPRAAKGFAHRIALNRERNLGKNHFVGGNVSAGGTHYFGESEFNEQNVQIEASYQHKTAKQTVGVSPFLLYRWLGGSRYNHSAGAKVEFSRQIRTKSGVYISGQHEQVRYRAPNHKRFYDGFNHTITARLQHVVAPSTLVFGGVQWEKSHRQVRSESSQAKGVHAGLRYNHKQWGARLYVRYQHRRFDAPHDLFLLRRKDKELRMVASVHHKKLAWKGIVPELNYVHDRYQSNVNLYNRRSGQFFVSVTKVI